MEGSPGQYHYPGGRNRFRTVKQLAQGHSGHNRKMVRKSMPSSSRMHLEIKKKSKSEEGAGCSCWGVPLSSAAASGLAPHPGYGHHRHHDTLGKVTVPMRVTLLDFLKLERKYGSPRGQRRVWCSRCPVCLLRYHLAGRLSGSPSYRQLPLLWLTSDGPVTAQQGSSAEFSSDVFSFHPWDTGSQDTEPPGS